MRADTSRSLVLSWNPPLPQHQNGIVRWYIVTINNGTQLTNYSTTANSYRVTAQIKPFRSYNCSVAAETIGVGPATEDAAVQTPEDSKCFPTIVFCHSMVWNCIILFLHAVPETAPLQFRVEATDSRTLVLSWEAPNPEDRNGIIRQYTVNITELDTGTLTQLVTNDTTITAFSQHPHYTYSCVVAAETSVGVGPFTSSRAVQMPEDGKYVVLVSLRVDQFFISPIIYVAPSTAPVGVMSSMVSSSGFTLMWNAPPPEDHNGIIRHYAIHITEVNTGMEYPLRSPVTQRMVDFLHPYYNYSCAVAAVTIQPGPFSVAHFSIL